MRLMGCMRVEDMDDIRLQSYITTCEECEKAIWVALSSPTADKLVCIQCLKKLAEKETEPIVLEKLTKRQLRDLKRAAGSL